MKLDYILDLVIPIILVLVIYYLIKRFQKFKPQKTQESPNTGDQLSSNFVYIALAYGLLILFLGLNFYFHWLNLNCFFFTNSPAGIIFTIFIFFLIVGFRLAISYRRFPKDKLQNILQTILVFNFLITLSILIIFTLFYPC